MHVEVAFDLATLFLEQHRQKKPGAEHLAERGKQSRASARAEWPGRMPKLRHEVAPDDDVTLLYIGQPCVNVFLFRVRLRMGQDPVQEGSVGFILPVMLERVNIRFVTRRAFRFGGGCHVWKYARKVGLSALKRGQPLAATEMS